MAAALPAPPVPDGANSDTQAHAILARERQGADVMDIPQMHQDLQDMLRQEQSARLRTLAKMFREN